VVVEAVEDLLLGFVANGTGVVEDQTFSESWAFIWQPKVSR
jgi:hypothetical protein